MRKLSAIGAALLIGGGLVAGAAPAQAQPDPGTISCGPLIAPICSAAGRQIQHLEEEVGHAYAAAYTYYEFADRTIRCVVFQQCP